MMTNNEKHRLTLRLPKQLNESLRRESYKQGISLNTLILIVLKNWIKKQENEKQSQEHT